MKFLMLVKEIFNFRDGRTVFVGNVYDGPIFIGSCECKLYVDNKYYGSIRIEGEMIASENQSGFRSLSTLDQIDVSKIPYHQVEVRLICEN